MKLNEASQVAVGEKKKKKFPWTNSVNVNNLPFVEPRLSADSG